VAANDADIIMTKIQWGMTKGYISNKNYKKMYLQGMRKRSNMFHQRNIKPTVDGQIIQSPIHEL
jgi:hypothetical protein